MTKHRFLIARQVGADPFRYTRTCLDTSRVERLRSTSLDDVTDLDAAYELTRLAMADLEALGTGGGETLDNEDIAVLVRSLHAVLKRLSVTLDLPFLDFTSFKRYWKQQGMSDSYDTRRNYINSVFSPVLGQLDDYHPHLRQGRNQACHVTVITRRRLHDGLTDGWWWGTLDEVRFLSRLYDLNNLPSHDPRFATAEQDIWQHCINNPVDWGGRGLDLDRRALRLGRQRRASPAVPGRDAAPGGAHRPRRG